MTAACGLGSLVNDLGRQPPVDVIRTLAAEVGFGCPVEGCGSPYLTWHHFDPPWAERHHHDPAGMIALCREHHAQADAGAFTREQLRELKRAGRDRAHLLQGRFNWMREELLGVIGGNFYVRVPIAVQIENVPVIYFNRDDSGRLLLNVNMPSMAAEPRMVMVDNLWITPGADEAEIRCPPSGRLVEAKYPNGDHLKVEFREIQTADDFEERYPLPSLPRDVVERLERSGFPIPDLSHRDSIKSAGIQFPVAAVEVTLKVAGTGLDFGPRASEIAGSQIAGSWIIDGAVGMQIGEPGERVGDPGGPH